MIDMKILLYQIQQQINPSINLGELRIDELDRLQGGEQTDLIHQTVNANLSYEYSDRRK